MTVRKISAISFSNIQNMNDKRIRKLVFTALIVTSQEYIYIKINNDCNFIFLNLTS